MTQHSIRPADLFNRLRRRRWSAVIVAVVLLIAVAGIVIFNRNRGADFTRFATSAQVQTYLESKLTLWHTTRAQVEAFIADQHITDCGSDTYSIICLVVAPGQIYSTGNWWRDWQNNTFIQWRYIITFGFDRNHILGKVAVQYTDLSF